MLGSITTVLLALVFAYPQSGSQLSIKSSAAPIVQEAPRLPPPQPNDPPVVKLPVDFSVGVGRLAKLTASSNGKTIKWAIYSDQADLIPSETGSWAIFASPNPGRYLVLAWTAVGDQPSDAAQCWITVGTPGPPPVPPIPPGPTPVPEPTDEWWLPLKTAYLQETPLDRVSLPLASQLYRQIATDASSWNGTVKAFVDQTSVKAGKALGTALPKVRGVLGTQRDAVLPMADGQMDNNTRTLISNTYLRQASLLDSLGRMK